jgi:predicted DNA-binding transcriptional regulator AlpA
MAEQSLLLSDVQAGSLLGVSRGTIWRRVKEGSLPKPIKLGGRTLWRRDELVDAIERATRARDGKAA